MKRAKKIILQMLIVGFITTVMVLVLLEIAVRIGILPDLTRLVTSSYEIVDDPYLKWRFAPSQHDLDHNGWRNAIVREQVDLVSLGDSQTYGYGADRGSAYPQYLEQRLGISVYNMGLPGSSAVEHSYLMEEALTYNPKYLTIGIYLGNDLAECYLAVQEREVWRYLRHDDFDYRQEFIGPEPPQDTDDAAVAAAVNVEAEGEANLQRRSLQRFLFQSKALGYLWYGYFRDWFVDEYAVFKAEERKINAYETANGNPQAYVSYEDDNVFIQFTPYRRYVAQNTADPVIEEGLRLCLECLTTIQERCEVYDLECVFILIPTKEIVYQPYLTQAGFTVSGYFADLVRLEAENNRRIRAHLDSLNAHYVDSTSDMQNVALEAAAQGVLLYPHDTNGHPNSIGYSIIGQNPAKMLASILDSS